jgi:hypothetical protein
VKLRAGALRVTVGHVAPGVVPARLARNGESPTIRAADAGLSGHHKQRPPSCARGGERGVDVRQNTGTCHEWKKGLDHNPLLTCISLAEGMRAGRPARAKVQAGSMP